MCRFLQQISSRKSRFGCSPRLTAAVRPDRPNPDNGLPPASLLLLLFAAKYQLSFASSPSPWRPLSSSTEGRAYHAIMATLSSPVPL
jgi:hypothetical protein